jgi:electron transfer flavoprotein alpha subunit/NAD-dependent dihydropyrimidine dehydrogenase PreA subunit
MSGIQILKDKCIGCGVCVSACPQNTIELDDENIAVIGDACNICGSCIKACPSEAIEKTGAGSENLDHLDVSHLADCRDIWVIVELREGRIASCTRELLGEAQRQIAGTVHKVAAVLLCEETGSYPRELIAAGADKVYLIKNKMFHRFKDQPYKEAIYRLVKEEKPLAILFSATAMGRSLAPRLAASLSTGLSADCTKLELRHNGILIQTRPAFGGNLFASILCPYTWPQMATVRPKVMQPIEPDATRQGKVIEKNYILDENMVLTDIIDYIPEIAEASIDDAEIVVAAGHGAATEKGLTLVTELAKVFGGALGASRKVVDAGLISYERQIGQTGKTIGPKLYIACGISGAIQHIVGMSSAKKIIAINIDPNAPIFHMADIGIVADLYTFIPKLIAAQKARKNRIDPSHNTQ